MILGIGVLVTAPTMSPQTPESGSEIATTELLWFAIFQGDAREVRRLLGKGANVNRSARRFGDTYLIGALLAEEEWDLEVILTLLEFGADPNLRGEDGWTPLAYAVISGRIEAVQLLLDYGAPINSLSNDYGDTILQTAVWYEQPAIFKYLLSRGADPRTKNTQAKDLYAYVQSGKIDMTPYF